VPAVSRRQRRDHIGRAFGAAHTRRA
jgi:hypothetical protein